MKAGDHSEMTAAGLDDQGRGVATVGDHDLHVADLLPGERALVAVDRVSRHRSEASCHIVRRLGPASIDRAVPPCPAFDRCGGCRWQHLAYPAQLIEKRKRLERTLGPLVASVAAPVAAPEVVGYRNKGKYVIAPGPRGPVVGAYRPGSHEVVSTLGCAVVEPAIDRAARAAAAVVRASELPIYDERTRGGALRYLILRAGSDARVLAALVTRSTADRAAVEAMAADLNAGCHDVSGVVWVRNDRTTGVLLDGEPEPLVGRPTVSELVGAARVELPIGAFWQINRGQAERLHQRLAARLELSGSARVVDAFAGAGAIALRLAQAGAEVVAIEREPSAVTAGRAAADEASLGDRLRFLSGDAADHLACAAGAIVVVNPPRKGLGGDAIAALARSGCRRIAYVSCGPESLARDLAALTSSGFSGGVAEPFDLMPGTSQIETLVVIDR